MLTGWRDYIWTEEMKARFLLVNNKFMEACEKARAEARARHNELVARMEAGDPFISDFEINIDIQPYMDTSEMTEEAETENIDFAEEKGAINFHFSSGSHSGYTHDDPEYLDIHFDKSFNWNDEYLTGNFDDEYICYAIHELLDSGWNFDNIMNINQIWVDVQVWLQNNEEF